ncbi:hypothetical protein [uncultured Friedmanniella sp.]|uniref:hypothetical protein n=1 Tax=uncultured Friedmanniella sp. TaxID=335381 RepID=UPI0035CA1F39
MAGASGSTQRVEFVNANWDAGTEGGDGRFGLLVVTADGERYELQPSPAAMTALVALTQASNVLLWDPEGATLIVANLVGEWLPPDTRQDGGGGAVLARTRNAGVESR